MAKLSILAGTTSKLIDIFVQDSSVTTGAGLTGLTSGSAGLTWYYYREGAGSATAVSIVSMTLGTFTSSGFIVVDGTNMPGVYQLGVPNAALAAGAKSVVMMLKGATNMAPVLIEIELTAVDNQDAVHFGLSALPNTAVTTNGSLITSGTGTDQLSVASGRIDIGKALGTAVTLDTNNVLNVSTKYLAGTALTGRDIGASVLLSSGTGTGQLDFTSGVVKSNLTQWNGTTVNGSVPLDTIFIRSNTAQAGGASTITLDASASATDNLYKNCILFIRSGTGAGQSNIIASYVGSTKVATMSNTWAINPDVTSVFTILAEGPAIANNTVTANVTQWLGGAIPAVNITGVPLVDVKYSLGTLSPATAGYFAPDWGHVNAPTTTVGLTNTTISTTQTITSVSGSVGSVTGAVGSVTGAVGSVTAAVTITAASVQAIWDALTSALTTVGSIGKLLVTDIDATISSRLASGSYTTPPTAAQNATELLDQAAGVETGLTVRQCLRVAASALFGKASGLAGTNALYRDTNDTKNRIDATVDANGNRTAVTLNLT